MEAKDMLIPALEEEVAKAADALKEVLELRGSLELSGDAREMTLDSLLEEFKEKEERISESKLMAAMPKTIKNMPDPFRSV